MPGHVELDKINKHFTYLATTDFASPPKQCNRIPSKIRAAQKRTADRLKARLIKLAKAKQRKRDSKTLRTFLVDSGASRHFVRAEDNLPPVGPSKQKVVVASGHVLKSAGKVQLPFEIKANARVAEEIDGLKNNSLISVGQLSDAD